MLAFRSWDRFGTIYTSLTPVRTSEIEILKKIFFGQKNENNRILLRKHVGTVDTTLSLVRTQEIDLTKKTFLDRKTKMLTSY